MIGVMVTVWLAPAETAVAHPAHWCRLSAHLLIARWRDHSCGYHDGYMSTVAGPRCGASCARPLAGGQLVDDTARPGPRIWGSHYHAKVTNDIHFNHVIGEFEPDALDDSPVPVSDTRQRGAVSRSLLTEGLSSTNMSGPARSSI
jgi:hypothetical protein